MYRPDNVMRRTGQIEQKDDWLASVKELVTDAV